MDLDRSRKSGLSSARAQGVQQPVHTHTITSAPEQSRGAERNRPFWEARERSERGAGSSPVRPLREVRACGAMVVASHLISGQTCCSSSVWELQRGQW